MKLTEISNLVYKIHSEFEIYKFQKKNMNKVKQIDGQKSIKKIVKKDRLLSKNSNALTLIFTTIK